jgi:predicted nucleic acid-binding protein
VSAEYLLDANALIALVISEHEHHDRAARWTATVERVALCPITEGALARYLIRAGESVATVSQLLSALSRSSGIDFWPDSLSYSAAILGHVTGHRQLTDAYLASLAASRNARLATFDRAFANTLPHAVLLIS